MDQEPEVIRQNIEETRSDLTRKIEVLEHEVIGTVKGTTAKVADTVENVKNTVENTVENVKDTIESTFETVRETFDLRLQTERHPWAMVGLSVGTGYVLGSLIPSTRTLYSAAPSLSDMASSSVSSSSSSAPSYQRAVSSLPPEPRQPGLLSRLLDQFQPEIQQLKGVAIGAAAAMVRDLLKERVPDSLQPHVQEMIHNVTQKLGGEDIQGPIFSQEEETTGRREYAHR